ncbi:Gp15 family bacteriophage protein [Diplocloster agilis]|uniref:Bacteriophage Gp15 family protein n=1 Tax=Diplocloster agilis TaxID=2850323 RepID=A0A949K1R0_9FIRM|nr:Gp15 family bacteriophage protein [Diplocloster agilis]MBU9739325.1 bacteriophage Gp15 family protein [Diplocloster agilis]
MGFLTEPIETIVRLGNRKYRVNAAFNVVLDVQRLYKEDLPDEVKIEQALRMLVENRFRVWCLPPKKKSELLQEVVKQHIDLPRRPPSKINQRLIDFELDGEYIFASFYQDYGIDLLCEQGRLHWKKFIALFQGLSEKTKIKEIMRIRDMDIPEPTKYNQKERQNIIELKSYYALPVEGGGGQEGLDALFCALEGMAHE